MLTIILEGAGGALLLFYGCAMFVPPTAPHQLAFGVTTWTVALGLCFLAFGRIMGWPV